MGDGWGSPAAFMTTVRWKPLFGVPRGALNAVAP